MKTVARNITGVLQILVIIILFSGMLFLCGSYIYSQSKGLITVLPPFPDNEKWVLTINPVTDGRVEKNSLLIPGFIGYSSNGEKTALPFERAIRKTALAQIENSIGLLFSGSEKELTFDLPVQKTDYFNKLFRRDFVYLGFHSEIPASAVFPLVAKEYENKSNVLLSYVTGLFLVPDREGNLYGVTFDRKGKLTELYPKESTPFNKEQLMAYTNKAELIPFDFALVDDMIPVALFAKSFPQGEAVLSLPGHDNSAESGTVKDILRAFGYQPNNTNYYTSPDGTVSFVENPGEISITKDGLVTFVASDTGIPLTEFVRYYPNRGNTGTYSFADIVYGVKLFVNSLDSNVFGGEAELGLSDITYDEKTKAVTLSLRYILDGVELPQEIGGMSLTFSGSNLVGAWLRMTHCAKSTVQQKGFSQKTAFAIIQNDLDIQSFLSFGPTYVKSREEEYGTVYQASWTLRTAQSEA